MRLLCVNQGGWYAGNQMDYVQAQIDCGSTVRPCQNLIIGNLISFVIGGFIPFLYHNWKIRMK